MAGNGPGLVSYLPGFLLHWLGFLDLAAYPLDWFTPERRCMVVLAVVAGAAPSAAALKDHNLFIILITYRLELTAFNVLPIFLAISSSVSEEDMTT